MAMKAVFQAVRLRAAFDRPYFALALFAADIIERPGLGTFAVDQWCRIYVDPEMVGSKKGQWSVEEAAWVLNHEIGHWLREHHARAVPIIAATDHPYAATVANLAQDMELNDEKEMAEHLPGDYCHPAKLKLPPNQLWEVYYAELLKSHPKPPPGSQARPDGDACDGAHGGYDCGSGAHGQSRPWEEPAPGAGGAPGIGDGEGALIRRAVASEIQAAAKSRSEVPAGWLRWADEQMTPATVPWERELAALVRTAVTMAQGMTDYTYTRFSRRGGASRVLQPALRRPAPEATVVLDTSGSMSDSDLRAALSEIEGILRAVGQRMVPVICCDAAASQAQRVRSARSVKLEGGGGTDMGVGIAAAEAMRSDVIIVLTDGETPWPSAPPRGQLVVGLVRHANCPVPTYSRPPKYARAVLHIPATPQSN